MVRTGTTNGTPVVSLDGSSVVFAGCTGPAGLTFAVKGYGTWNINIADSSNGVSTGTVTNIRANIKSTAGPACSFDLGAGSGSFVSSGTATVSPAIIAGSYSNSTRHVDVPASNPGSFGIWNVRGGNSNAVTYCVSRSILKQGDRATVGATWTMTADNPAYNPIAIS